MKLQITALILVLASSLGFVGGESSGGGGNSAAAEFNDIAIWTLNSLTDRGEIELQGRKLDIHAMSRMIFDSKVQATKEQLVLNGIPVHAINYPDQKLIVLNQDNWKTLDQKAKVQLCLHEYWGLTFADHADDNYVYSSALADMVLATSFKNPSQIMSAVSTDTDLGGRTVRAMVLRKRTKTAFTFELVIETITDYNEIDSVITSHVVYALKDLPFKAKWGIQNLRLSETGFEFELNYYLPEQVTCQYPLPTYTGSVLEKLKINCHPTTPGKIENY